MSGQPKPQEEGSTPHHAEDIEMDVEAAPKPTTNVKGADRAAQLIGDQHIEVTEEDVSTMTSTASRMPS